MLYYIRMDIRYQLLRLAKDASESIDSYIQFLEQHQASESADIPVHKHHILPRCLYPEYRSFSTNAWNLAVLKPEDHLVAHNMLLEVFPNNARVYTGYVLLARSLGSMSSADFRLKMKDLLWVYKGTEQLRVLTSTLEKYIKEGWKLGCLHTRNHLVPIFKDNTEKRVSAKDLPLYLSSGWTRGRVSVRKPSKNRDKVIIFKDSKSIMVSMAELPHYLNQGWRVGNGQKGLNKSMWKGEIVRRIKNEEIEHYLSEGWKFGNPKIPKGTNSGKTTIYNCESGEVRLVIPSYAMQLLEENPQVWAKGRPNQLEISASGGKASRGVPRTKTVWITNHNIETKVRPEKVDEYISSGWVLGRLYRPRKRFCNNKESAPL